MFLKTTNDLWICTALQHRYPTRTYTMLPHHPIPVPTLACLCRFFFNFNIFFKTNFKSNTLGFFLKKLILLATPIFLAWPNACAAPCMVAQQLTNWLWLESRQRASCLELLHLPRPHAHPPIAPTTEACVANELRTGNHPVTPWHRTLRRRRAPCWRAFCNRMFHAFQMYVSCVFSFNGRPY